MARKSAFYRFPDPWRGWLTARRARRWATATRGAARHNALLPADAPTLNFWPHRPQPIAPIYEIMRRLGLRAGFDPCEGQPAMAWEGGTWVSAAQAARLPANAINGRCRDISKSRVAGTWERVAGYPLTIDPLTYEGPLVEKSEENGRQRGRILHGPLARQREGFVYQKLVDCRIGDQVHQMRILVTGRHLALAYEKWRPVPEWFSGTRISVPRHVDALLPAPEQELLLRFTAAMEMDYAELDVLRDEPSGLIYVVDANRTPTRAHNLAQKDWAPVYDIQAAGFRELLAPWGLADVPLREVSG